MKIQDSLELQAVLRLPRAQVTVSILKAMEIGQTQISGEGRKPRVTHQMALETPRPELEALEMESKEL